MRTDSLFQNYEKTLSQNGMMLELSLIMKVLMATFIYLVDYRIAGIRIFMLHDDFDSGGGVAGFPRLISRPLLPTLTVWRCFPRPISSPRTPHASCKLPYPVPPLALPAPPKHVMAGLGLWCFQVSS